MNNPMIMRPPGFQLADFIESLKIEDGIMAEIGSYTGESTKEFAESGKFKLIHAIDAWENGYDRNDAASYICNMLLVEREFDERMKDFSIINKLKMLSVDAAILFEDYSLDLVYIDANHEYESVKQDILAWEKKIKIGGVISGHDYHDGQPGVIMAVNEIFGAPEKTFSDYSWCVTKRI